MKKLILALGLMTLAGGALAAAKLDAKGVTGYKLEIVKKGEPAGKVIGSCEAGTKEIVYRRG